jgi:hypothetical protein
LACVCGLQVLRSKGNVLFLFAEFDLVCANEFK